MVPKTPAKRAQYSTPKAFLLFPTKASIEKPAVGPTKALDRFSTSNKFFS